VPLDKVRLTAAKFGFGRHRKLRLARPQGSAPVSASDDELRLARPRARTRSRPRKTTNSASPDPGLGLGLGPRRRRTPPRPTRGSDSTSTLEDRLDLDLGGASASPDPGLGPTTSQGAIIIRLRGTRPTSHLARPGKQIMMAPHVLHDDGGSQPLTEARRRKQGLDSPDSCPSARLQRSSDGHDIT
jgi:hypothetical protein